MPVGTYTLVVERTVSDAVAVGALGEVLFPAGWYAYVGSAFGPGGFIVVVVSPYRRSTWPVPSNVGEKLQPPLSVGSTATARSPAASATSDTGTSTTCSATRPRDWMSR